MVRQGERLKDGLLTLAGPARRSTENTIVVVAAALCLHIVLMHVTSGPSAVLARFTIKDEHGLKTPKHGSRQTITSWTILVLHWLIPLVV